MKIITQCIYRKQGNNSNLVQELIQTKWELEISQKGREKADRIINKIARKLDISKNDPDYTYEGIYKVFEESLEAWKKVKPKSK